MGIIGKDNDTVKVAAGSDSASATNDTEVGMYSHGPQETTSLSPLLHRFMIPFPPS